MARRKGGGNVSVTLLPNSDSEGENEEPKRVETLPEQHIHRDAHGHMQHAFTLVQAPASPTKPSKPTVSLRPDLPASPSAGGDPSTSWAEAGFEAFVGEDDGPPVYDAASQERDPEERGPILKERRALRSSVSPAFDFSVGVWLKTRYLVRSAWAVGREGEAAAVLGSAGPAGWSRILPGLRRMHCLRRVGSHIPLPTMFHRRLVLQVVHSKSTR